ncbi:MAG: hypothetical protein P8X65_14575 [Syntrophobacterales bacterium]|jgi:hypothetical protein
MEKKGEEVIKFGVRAFEFIDNFRITEEKLLLERPTGILIVKKNSNEPITWTELYRIIAKVNEVINATSALIESLAEISKKEISLPSPTILSIKFSSPGVIKNKIDLGVAKILKVLLEKYQFWGLQKERYTTETRGIEIDNETKQLLRTIEVMREAVNFRIEAIESGIDQVLVDSLFYTVIKRALDIDELPSPLFEKNSLERGIINKRLLPAITELVAGDDPSIEVEIKDDDENEENNTRG